MKSTLLLRFEPELKQKLKDTAQLEQRSLNSLIVKIVFDYVRNYERRNK